MAGPALFYACSLEHLKSAPVQDPQAYSDMCKDSLPKLEKYQRVNLDPLLPVWR